MIGKSTKGSLYVIALTLILVTTICIYSCSNDDYDYKQKTEANDAVGVQMNSLDITDFRNTLIDSVANSGEFWEFERSTQCLSDKFMEYTAMWSQEKYDKLMSNMNNDEYVEELIKLADLTNELAQLDRAKENLMQNTVFLKLSESERTKLFTQFAESQTLLGRKRLKTPREEGSDKCELLRQAAYALAKETYDNDIANCKSTSGSSYICHTLAMATYNSNKKAADKNYEECKQN